MKAARRAIVALPAALGLAAITVYTADAGSANVAARAVSNEISTWSMLAGGPRPDTLASVRNELLTLEGNAPDRAYVDELIGIAAARDRQDPKSLEEAKMRFTMAVRSRPVSPYTWANLVHVSYELGQTGEEFERALRHAASLGPWEPEVQNTVVNYGLAVHEEVSPATQAAIDRTVAAAMKLNPLETLQIAARRGRLDVACRGIVNPASDPSRRYMLCQEWERTS